MEKRRERMIKNIILFLPLVLSIGWALQIRISNTIAIANGNMLSPIDTQPLLTSLILFIIGYLFFLFLMFSDDIKSFLIRKTIKHQ